MNFTQRLSIALLGLLAAACAITFAGNLDDSLQGHPSFRLEPGRRRHGSLGAQNRARLGSLEDGIRLRYYATPRADLPPHLAHLEENVRDVFGAFERAANELGVQLSTRIVHPDEHPEWAAALASAGLASWRARRVEGDGYREDELWSSLRIGYGARPAALFNGIGNEQVFELQDLILEQLEELREPRRPRVAISAPAGYENLRTLLASGADVFEVDFDERAELPARIDLFFWLEPAQAGDAQLAALDALRAAGGSLVLAGRDIESQARVDGESFVVEFEEGPGAMNALLRHHGLTTTDELLLDSSAGQMSAGGLQQFVPWYVLSTANHQDFRTLRGQPNGSLLFRTPSAFEPEPMRLAELGLGCTVLATASAGASLHELPPSPLRTEEVDELRGRRQPNAALAALLRPTDPWTGRVLALADSAVFGDANWDHEHYAHQTFAQVLLTTLLSSQRMVAGRIAARAPASLPRLSSSARAWWRFLVVVLLPGLLALVFLGRHARASSMRGVRRNTGQVLFAGAALVALVAFGVRAFPAIDADLSRDGRNRLTGEERAVFLERLQEPTTVELVFSPPGDLPPEFKPLVRELRSSCDRLARAFDGLEVTSLWPAAASAQQLAELQDAGLRPLRVTSLHAEATRQFRIHAGLRVRRAGQQVVLEFPSARSFRHLHFRLALALESLQRGRPAQLALFAAPPRISPAEAAIEYQRRGLFAPREGDVYSELADLLTEFDFDVTRLEAGRDRVPPETDALLWLQPRRDLLDTAGQLAQHLHGGGAALVAGQHFRMLSRQLEGTGLQQRFWPEPQFFDLDRVYLPPLGIELPREVALDVSHGSMQLQTRVHSSDGGSQHVTLPTTEAFLVVGHTLDALGAATELLMPFASELRWDADQLAQQGLKVTPWIEGGAQHWSYNWSGGDLPSAVLDPEAVAEPDVEARITRSDTAACYGALFEGSFPGARVSAEPRELTTPADAKPSGQAGKLLLLGSSETFKNGLLSAPQYEHEDFALRAVASICLPPELLPLLATRQHEPALGPVDTDTRRLWRTLVLAGAPGLLLLFGLLRRRVA